MIDPAGPAVTDKTRRITHGPLAFEMFRFGAPLAVGMALQVTFNLVDAYLIARLPEGVAGPSIGAVGICDQLAAVGTILSYGLSTATAALVAQRKGAGDDDGARKLAWQSLILTGLLSLIFGLLGLGLAGPIVRDLVGAKGEVARLAVTYLRVIVGGSFSIFFLLQLTSIMRALGSAKTPMTILVLGNVLNLVLAVLLVYGEGPRPAVFAFLGPLAHLVHAPRLELAGAAWATIIARTVVLIPAVVVLVRRGALAVGKEQRRPDPVELRRIWDLGWPSSTQFVVRMLAFVATTALIAHAFTSANDQTATTAYGVIFRVESMALFVSMGWGSAAQTFTGTCHGAGLDARGKRAGLIAAGYDALAMALLAWAAVRWAVPILGFFDPTPAVIAIGREYLGIVAFSYVGYGAAIVLGNAYAGFGATRVTLRLDLLVVLALQIPLMVGAVKLHGQRHGLFAAIAIAYLASAALYVATYVRHRPERA